jgi:hypothetical protein
VSVVTPPGLRGRVMAADYVVGAGGPQLGSVEAGAVGSLATPAISALSGGLLVIVSTAAIALALPAFRRYRSDGDGGADGAAAVGEAGPAEQGENRSATRLPSSTPEMKRVNEAERVSRAGR